MELAIINKELHEASKRLDKGSKELFNLAKDYAKKEATYRRELAIEIDRLKQVGQSVTLIPDIARGKKADLKEERDLAEFKYTAARESLKAIQIQISALQSILRYQTDV